MTRHFAIHLKTFDGDDKMYVGTIEAKDNELAVKRARWIYRRELDEIVIVDVTDVVGIW